MAQVESDFQILDYHLVHTVILHYISLDIFCGRQRQLLGYCGLAAAVRIELTSSVFGPRGWYRPNLRLYFTRLTFKRPLERPRSQPLNDTAVYSCLRSKQQLYRFCQFAGLYRRNKVPQDIRLSSMAGREGFEPPGRIQSRHTSFQGQAVMSASVSAQITVRAQPLQRIINFSQLISSFIDLSASIIIIVSHIFNILLSCCQLTLCIFK